MDICSWNWGAIGSFIGAAATIYAAHIAIYISNQWYKQKQIEVIATESKDFWYELDKLESIYSELKNTYNHVPKEFYNLVDQWLKVNNRKIKLIKNLFDRYRKDTSDVDILLDKISKEIDDFESKVIFRNIRIDGVSTYEEVNQEEIINLIKSLKNNLSDFIIYKK